MTRAGSDQYDRGSSSPSSVTELSTISWEIGASMSARALAGPPTPSGSSPSISSSGRGDSPNRHDILTGSNLDGTAFLGEGHDACGNWTSNSSDGSARVGHHDRIGGGQNPTSWNNAHGSRGCGQSDLQGTGGDGLYYCFALDGDE